MKTGRVDYAPDYKSEEYIPCSSTDDRSEAEWTVIDTHNLRVAKARDAELARLERCVIELAKKTRAKGVSGNCPAEDCKAYYAAVDALIEFQSQEKGSEQAR